MSINLFANQGKIEQKQSWQPSVGDKVTSRNPQNNRQAPGDLNNPSCISSDHGHFTHAQSLCHKPSRIDPVPIQLNQRKALPAQRGQQIRTQIIPRVIFKNSDRSHHKNVAKIKVPANIHTQSTSTMKKPQGDKRAIASLISASLPRTGLKFTLSIPRPVHNQSPADHSSNVSSSESVRNFTSQQSVFRNFAAERATEISVSQLPPFSSSGVNTIVRAGGTSSNIVEGCSDRVIVNEDFTRPTKFSSATASVIASTASSQSHSLPAVGPSHAAMIKATANTPRLSMQDLECVNSHVITNNTISNRPCQACEQDMTSTPTLSVRLSSSPSSQPMQHRQGADSVGSIIESAPQTEAFHYNSSATSSKPTNSFGGVRMKSRPKRKGLTKSPPAPSQRNDNVASPYNEISANNHAKFDKGLESEPNECTIHGQIGSTTIDHKSPKPFSWDLYLQISPTEVAPKEAFNQPLIYPKNNFRLNMKLEVRDPRNSYVWGLASVVGIEGLFLRLRFDNTDKSNDVFELIDSNRIRPIGSTGEPLLAPINFKGNIANYSKFVEKVLSEPNTMIAPPEYFPPPPEEPKKNLFQIGMRLEAVDHKNPDLICPATIGQVEGSMVKIVFDGWRGSFDYKCDYRSRDLFPINWCRNTGHYIQPPNGWDELVKSGDSSNSLHPTIQKEPSAVHMSRLISSQSKNSPSRAHKNDNRLLRDSSFKKSSSSKPGKRGRPAKNVSKVSPKIVTKATSSEPTKAMRSPTSLSFLKESDPPESRTPSPSLYEERSSSTASDEGPPGVDNRYQCQRTVSYDEWKRRKMNYQMPLEIDNSVIAENGDDNFDNNEKTSNNSSFSDSTSSMTSAQNVNKCNQNLFEPGQNKKLKPDTSSDAQGDAVSNLLRQKSSKVTDWTVQDVVDLLSTDETLAKYSKSFFEHEIDGKAFILLKEEILLRHMGFKLGTYLKIADLIDRVKRLN